MRQDAAGPSPAAGREGGAIAGRSSAPGNGGQRPRLLLLLLSS